MTQRINYVQQSPELFKKFLEFSALAEKGAIEQKTRDLVAIRASQLNGCAFCLDMHVKQAKMHGERELRLHHVAIWRESPLFTPKERAALEWTEVLTRIPAEGIADAAYAAVSEHFSPEDLSELTWRVAAINGWNRMNVAVRNLPGSQDKMFGLDKAGLN